MSSDEQRTGNMNQCLQIKFYVRLLVLACVTLCPEASNRVRPPPTGVGNSRDPKLAIPQHKCLQYKKQTCGKHCCNSRVFSFSDKENIFEMLAEKEPALAEEIQERHLRSVGKVKDLQSCDIEATDCFKRVLETRTFQQELILSAVNYAYMDLALNLVNCMSVDSATIFTRSPYTVLHKEPLSDFNLIVASDGEYANVDFVYAQDAEP
eukprot:gene31781-40074_t